MAELLSATSLMAFVALTALEIVLGVDNLVFIAILTGRLPPEQRGMRRQLGLAMAAIGRIVLLLAASWVITLEESKLFTMWAIWKSETSIRDVILIAGGLFLLAKAPGKFTRRWKARSITLSTARRKSKSASAM